jgi:hypothetical protein
MASLLIPAAQLRKLETISVHLYGPRKGGLDGRDYHPSRDHACDRFDG